MLERIFIKNYQDVTNAKVRREYGALAGKFGLITNLVLGIVKLIIGFVSNSISIMADAFNNITDSVSSIITIVGFNLVNKKPTKVHPYGYARYEYVCGFVISLFMLLMGCVFLKESIVKIFNKEAIIIDTITFVILIIAVIVKSLQMKVYLDFSKKIDSSALKTSAVDTRNDIISSIGILLSMIIMKVFNINIDGYVGCVVSIITIYSSIKMIREVLKPIIGIMPDKDKVEEIRNKLLSYDNVIGIHDLLIHNYGVNNDFITVHVEIDSKMDMITSHDIIDNIEHEFKDIGYDLTIHLDPVVVGDKKTDRIKKQVINAIKKLDSELDIHDFRMVEGMTHINLIFDCVVPYHKDYRREEIVDYLRNNVIDKKHKYYYVIEIDRPFC